MSKIFDPEEPLSAFLKTRREFLGLSLRQLSQRTGVSVTTIYAWERGRLPLCTPQLFRVLHELGIMSLDLFALEERKTAPFYLIRGQQTRSGFLKSPGCSPLRSYLPPRISFRLLMR